MDAHFVPEMLAAVSHHFLRVLDEIPDIGTRPLQSSQAKSTYIRNHYYSAPGQRHNYVVGLESGGRVRQSGWGASSRDWALGSRRHGSLVRVRENIAAMPTMRGVTRETTYAQHARV